MNIIVALFSNLLAFIGIFAIIVIGAYTSPCKGGQTPPEIAQKEREWKKLFVTPPSNTQQLATTAPHANDTIKINLSKTKIHIPRYE